MDKDRDEMSSTVAATMISTSERAGPSVARERATASAEWLAARTIVRKGRSLNLIQAAARPEKVAHHLADRAHREKESH